MLNLPLDIIFIIGKNLEPDDYLKFSTVSKYVRKSLVYGRIEGTDLLRKKYFQNQIDILKLMMNDTLYDPFNIKKYPNVPEYIKLAAVKQSGYAIYCIKDPSEEVKLAAVKQNGRTIQFIKDPSEEVKLAAVQQDGHAIGYINNPSENVQLAAVQQYGEAIKFIKNPSEEVQLASVKQDGKSIYYIEDPSEEVQLAAVKQDGKSIKYIENPSVKFSWQLNKMEIESKIIPKR